MNASDGLGLEVVPGELAICRLEAGAGLPGWLADRSAAGLVAVTRTQSELSIVCPSESVPTGVEASSGWAAIRVAGTLDHELTGILASLATPLAAARIPIFAISTFDTDYVLVPAERLEEAREALQAAGHRFG